MLSRHFLRAKALQTLYAAVANNYTSTDEVAKTFDYNVRRLNDLGLYQLSTLGELQFAAERFVENETRKFNPQQEDIDAMRLFADNVFITKLDDSFEFKQQRQRLHVDWDNNFDIFRKILTTFRSSRQYADYLKSDENDFEAQRNIAITAFKYLVNDQTLRDIIYERDLLWEDDFDQVAQYVYMILKELGEEDVNEAMRCPQVYDIRNDKEVADYNFARQLAVDAFAHLDDVEPMIRKHLLNWELERVAMMDILLINMAVTEFTSCPSIPERVTVDEYIELSKEFSTEKSKLFINGILDKILIELRVAGRVVKNSRGLYDPEVDGDTPPEE